MQFAELCCHSYYSFLDGASSPEDLVLAAVEQGLPALALTDKDGLYGVMPFYSACRAHGIHPVIGADLTLDGGDRLSVLCPDMQAYHQLSQTISASYVGREKSDPLVSSDLLQQLAPHVFAIAGGKSSMLAQLLKNKNWKAAEALLMYYRSLFGERLSLAINLHLDEGDNALAARTAELSRRCDVPLIASNAARYANKERGMLYDVLRCIKERCTLRTSHAARPGNHQRYLKGPNAMASLFQDWPGALARSVELAQACQLNLDFTSYRLPNFAVPGGHDANSYLEELCRDRVGVVYSDGGEELEAKLVHELQLIGKLKLAGYFLLVWDIVQFARHRGIPVQGRGSAANSLVAYILGITPVDPIRHKLFLGRFINEDMVKIPDIDLDFASSRDPTQPDREDVIRYVYERYGRDHVAMVCTFVTFQARNALREVGKVFELSDDLIQRLCRLVGQHSVGQALKELQNTPQIQGQLQGWIWEQLALILEQIAEVPRHLGVHVGGMIISSIPLSQLVPIEPARMEGRAVCQWDKDGVDDAGLIKVDILGLGMLAVLRECEQILADSGEDIDLFSLPHDDPKVYQTISNADTVGVFQVESRAQMQSLPRTQPRNFDELGIQVAIIRPGPLQGNMVAPYILRKQGKEKVSYLHPSLEPVLKDTLGVILFQEQVLQVAVAIAGFTPAQADSLRRAMSRRRSQDAMQALKGRFLSGARLKGVADADAEAVFASLEGFALYGFCKSHALSFARLCYLSAWLKLYHPAAFTAALVNNQPMGFYPIDTVLEDARRHGVDVRPVDINHSRRRSALEDGALRLGLNKVQGLSEAHLERILRERGRVKSFLSLRQFYRICSLPLRNLEGLIEGGVFDGLGLERRDLLWQAWVLDRESSKEPTLFDMPSQVPALPKADVWALMRGEYSRLGVSLQGHPMAHLRVSLPPVRDARAVQQADNGQRVVTAGLVVCRQRPPTAKGFGFLTIEDEFGMMNLIVPPQVYERCRAAFRSGIFIWARGTIDRRDGVLNLRLDNLRELHSAQV